MVSFSAKKEILESYGYKIKAIYQETSDACREKDEEELSNKEFIARMYIHAWSSFSYLVDRPQESDEKIIFNRGFSYFENLEVGDIDNNRRRFLYFMLRCLYEFEFNSADSGFTDEIWRYKGNVLKLDDISDMDWGVNSSGFKPKFSWICDGMYISILKDILNSNEFKKAKGIFASINNVKEDISALIEQANSNASNSVEYLGGAIEEVKVLSDKVLGVKMEGNFKLLSKAFSTIKESKSQEKIFAQCRMWFFILMITILPGYSIFHYKEDVVITLNSLAFYAPLISLEIVFFYFMRLFYLEVKSIKAQLLQIDLRLNLCEFIFDYVEKRKESGSNEIWKSFEALIFSPIQSNEEKIPAVLDGVDVMAEITSKVLKKE